MANKSQLYFIGGGGAVGPQGPTGPQGPEGPKGDPGEPGEPGVCSGVLDQGKPTFPVALWSTEIRTCKHSFSEAYENFLDQSGSSLFTTQSGRRYGFRAVVFVTTTEPQSNPGFSKGQIIQEYFAMIKNDGGVASLSGAVTKLHGQTSDPALAEYDATLHAEEFSGDTFKWQLDWVGNQTVNAVLVLQWAEMEAAA